MASCGATAPACGYLIKHALVAELVNAVRAAAEDP